MDKFVVFGVIGFLAYHLVFVAAGFGASHIPYPLQNVISTLLPYFN